MSTVAATPTTPNTPTQPSSPVPLATLAAPSPEQAAAAAEAEARLAALVALGDVTQANAVTGLYGDSGTGKSTLAQTGVEYCWTRFHKISRYVIADPGGFGNKLLRLIRLGIAQVYNPTNHIEPFETMEDLSLGYWPEKIDDPYTGYAAPDVRLVPPQETRWTVFCKQGHEVRTIRDKKSLNGFSLQCPTCKGTPVTPQTWGRVEEVTVRSPWIKHVGLYVFDSGTSLEDWAMEDMAGRAAKNDPGIKDGNSLSATGARILSGKYAFGANTQQHYGFAQNRMRQWIKNARTIPGQVLPPIITFLELRATDDSKNLAIYGPKIAGNAKTSDVPSWLGNCLHTSKDVNLQGKSEHRLWLVNHTDPGSFVPHLAKTRAEPGSLPPYLADGPDDPPFTKFSLGYFFDQLEVSLQNGSRQDVQDFPDAPLFAPLVVEGTEDVIGRKDLSGKETGVIGGPARIVPTAPGVVRPPAPPGVAAGAVAVVPSQYAPPGPVTPPPPAAKPPIVKPASAGLVPGVTAPPPLTTQGTKPGPSAGPVPVAATQMPPAGAPSISAAGPTGPSAPAGRPPTPPAAMRPMVRPVAGSQVSQPAPPGKPKP